MSPIHIAPFFRSKEDAMEQAGVIAPLNSDGLNAQSNEELAGKKPVVSPVSKTFSVNGKTITAKQ